MRKNISSLKEARNAAGMTQEQLANAIYVTRTAISNIELNENLSSLPVARAICETLNCSWDIFFEDDSNSDEKAQKAFAIYINNENDASEKITAAELKTKHLEKEFLKGIGAEHRVQLDELVSNIMYIWLEAGFAAGYTAK